MACAMLGRPWMLNDEETPLSDDWTGAIDCDLHPRAPTWRARCGLYMDEHWRDTAEVRGIDAWETISYPANAPLTMRPDWRDY